MDEPARAKVKLEDLEVGDWVRCPIPLQKPGQRSIIRDRACIVMEIHPPNIIRVRAWHRKELVAIARESIHRAWRIL